MAKRNFDTSDITEQMEMHITIIKELMEEDTNIDWYRMCGTRKRGIRVLYNGSEILEIWSDNKDTEYDDVGSICTKFLDDEGKKQAVTVSKHDYAEMGESVFSLYAYHDDWSYKWSIHANNYADLKMELRRCITAYKRKNDV